MIVCIFWVRTVPDAYCRAVLSLPETLVRIEARIAETGLDRSGLLDTQDISRRTALRKSKVEAQLGGSVPPDEPVEDRVRGRTAVARSAAALAGSWVGSRFAAARAASRAVAGMRELAAELTAGLERRVDGPVGVRELCGALCEAMGERRGGRRALRQVWWRSTWRCRGGALGGRIQRSRVGVEPDGLVTSRGEISRPTRGAPGRGGRSAAREGAAIPHARARDTTGKGSDSPFT